MTAAAVRYANPERQVGHAGSSAPVHTDPRLELVTLKLCLPPDQALALAQFCKRSRYADFRANAIDQDEAYLMIDAIDALRRELATAGYAPR